MLTQLIISISIGISLGIITGLTPGIHVNLVALLLISATPLLAPFLQPICIAVIIISCALTHTFLDSIPSIFLGAPDSATALSVLPGHRMLLNGHGFEAIKFTVIGSLFSLIITILLIPIMIPLAPIIYKLIQPFIGYILIIVIFYMILIESSVKKKTLGLSIFLLSGILGYLVLNLPNLNQPLFPLLSGLFGISTLLISLNSNSIIPKQTISNNFNVSLKSKLKAFSAAVFSGSLTGLLPGLGSAQAAIIAMQIVGKIGVATFLILIGGINTVNFLFSLVTFYTLQKARNGAVVAITQIISTITIKELILFISTALICAGIATFLTLKISKIFAKYIVKVDYQKLCISIISLIALLTIYFNGMLGLLILSTSTAIGILPAIFRIKRSLAMGCLILPVIVYFVL